MSRNCSITLPQIAALLVSLFAGRHKPWRGDHRSNNLDDGAAPSNIKPARHDFASSHSKFAHRRDLPRPQCPGCSMSRMVWTFIIGWVCDGTFSISDNAESTSFASSRTSKTHVTCRPHASQPPFYPRPPNPRALPAGANHLCRADK